MAETDAPAQQQHLPVQHGFALAVERHLGAVGTLIDQGEVVATALDPEHLLYATIKPGPGGTGPLHLTSLQLLDRLAALLPPPRIHRHRYFGVLAPNAPLRTATTTPPTPRRGGSAAIGRRKCESACEGAGKRTAAAPANAATMHIDHHDSAAMTTTTYTQIGVELSLYSGKMRSYLRHKRIPFVERPTNPWEFSVTVPRRTQAHAVPVVITPEGEWLQDTSAIIDELERRFPANPVLPSTPILRFASFLFEIWGDEFWLPLAMHGRWSHDENLPLFLNDAGAGLMPGFPRWLQRAAGWNHVRLMRNHLPRLGITPEQIPLIDRFAQIQLDGLNRHFEHHLFLFGGRPSLGDYGLIGPLYAHLGRDPWPKRELIAPRPHLAAWIGRMLAPPDRIGEFQAEDRVAETLTPALRSILDEIVPYLTECERVVRKTPVLPANSRKVPRFFDEIRYPLAGGVFRQMGQSYPVWMTQRMLGAFRQTSAADQQAVRAWLDSVGGSGVLQLDPPRVQRIGLAAARIA